VTPCYYFSLGAVPNTPLTRYAVVAGDGVTVLATQISVPDLVEIERPAVLRWLDVEANDVQIKRYRINEAPLSRNGQQPRRTTWKRAGRRAEGGL
jgi:hypothetical protein